MVVYTILKAPKEGGSVYTIAPADDRTKVKHVHRMMLKAVVGGRVPECTGTSPSPLLQEPLSEDEPYSDGDLFLLRSEVPQAAPTQTAMVTQTPLPLQLPLVGPAPVVPGPSSGPYCGGGRVTTG